MGSQQLQKQDIKRPISPYFASPHNNLPWISSRIRTLKDNSSLGIEYLGFI